MPNQTVSDEIAAKIAALQCASDRGLLETGDTIDLAMVYYAWIIDDFDSDPETWMKVWKPGT